MSLLVNVSLLLEEMAVVTNLILNNFLEVYIDIFVHDIFTCNVNYSFII